MQEIWYKKKRNNKEMERAVVGTPWNWYGNIRSRQKRKDKKGSGGTGFLVHESAGKARRHSGNVNGVIWLELEADGETTHVINVYLVPTDSPRTRHNENAMQELERVLACTAGERRVVLGDWNARIGEHSSFVFTGEEEECGGNAVLAEKEYAECGQKVEPGRPANSGHHECARAGCVGMGSRKRCSTHRAAVLDGLWWTLSQYHRR